MTEETKQGKKWVTPEAGYKLKSDVGAICAATVERYAGKEFGQWYVEFCRDLGERFKKYGERTIISDKQRAVLSKLEINNWPDGVQPEPRPAAYRSTEQYGALGADDVPF